MAKHPVFGFYSFFFTVSFKSKPFCNLDAWQALNYGELNDFLLNVPSASYMFTIFLVINGHKMVMS